MSATSEVVFSVLFGAALAVIVAPIVELPVTLLIGWDAAAASYMILIWLTILRRDARETAQRSTTTDPDRALTDLLLLTAAVASLIAVGVVLRQAAQNTGTEELLQVGLGLVSVIESWAMVHTVFTLRYAHLYYAEPEGGIDFNDPDPPTYADFAYLAFTIGMTFQVSDTALKSNRVRRAALRHALLSYVFGTGILATTINLVASLKP